MFDRRLVGGIIIRGIRLELRGAGVHALVGRHHAQCLAQPANFAFAHPPQVRNLPVREAVLLRQQQIGAGLLWMLLELLRGARAAQIVLDFDQLADVLQKPTVDVRPLMNLLQAESGFEGVADVPDALGRRRRQHAHDLVHRRLVRRAPAVGAVAAQAETARFQAAQRFLQRLLEGAANRHRLADRLHLRRQRRVGVGEFLERPARNLRHHIVDGRLETGRRLARDVVAQFVEPVADGEFRRDLGDGEAGRLRGQSAGARHARIHLDGDHVAVVGIDGELNVAAAGLDADLADDGQRRVAHPLIFLVGQRLRRGDRDAVAGVDAHRIEVFDAAHDDDVVGLVAHHLQLVFLPADDRLLDQHLADRTEVEAVGDQLVELLAVVGDAAAAAAHREARPQHTRQTDAVADVLRLGQRSCDAALGHRNADLLHRLLEFLAILGLVDDGRRGTDHLDLVFFEDAVAVQVHRAVERRLAAERRQQHVGPFALDDAGQRFPGDRLDIGAVGRLRIGHDRGRIGVDQHHLVALFAQGLARLGAAVIELARLADDDRTGADEEDFLDVGTSRHICEWPSTLRELRWSLDRGCRAESRDGQTYTILWLPRSLPRGGAGGARFPGVFSLNEGFRRS